MSNFEYITTDGSPIKAWIKGVQLEDAARQQLVNVASLPFIHKHVAAMPDVHYGKGATIGSVIPTKGAIIPAAVGVDIGCGMMAVQTTLSADQLPDNLLSVRSDIEAAVPHGRTDRGGKNDRGAWGEMPQTGGRALVSPVRSIQCNHRETPESPGSEQRPAHGHARHRQPFHRGLPGRE